MTHGRRATFAFSFSASSCTPWPHARLAVRCTTTTTIQQRLKLLDLEKTNAAAPKSRHHRLRDGGGGHRPDGGVGVAPRGERASLSLSLSLRCRIMCSPQRAAVPERPRTLSLGSAMQFTDGRGGGRRLPPRLPEVVNDALPLVGGSVHPRPLPAFPSRGGRSRVLAQSSSRNAQSTRSPHAHAGPMSSSSKTPNDEDLPQSRPRLQRHQKPFQARAHILDV